jgi:hypothetical protein
MSDATTGMARDYAVHSAYQHATAAVGEALVAPLAKEAAEAVGPVPTFVVADYGCGTGTASLAAVADGARAARAAGAGQIACLHVDLLTNPWDQLFAAVAAEPASYLHMHDPPLPMAAAHS